MSWYVLQTQSNRENKVATDLRMMKEKSSDLFDQVVVPEENIIENNASGDKRTIKKRLFPGYVFVEGNLSDELLLGIKTLRFASGFIGGNSPAEMTDIEVEKMLEKSLSGDESEGRYEVTFTTGEEIVVNDGPFEGFNGNVLSCDYDKNILEISIAVFGRDTSIDLEFKHVSKI